MFPPTIASPVLQRPATFSAFRSDQGEASILTDIANLLGHGQPLYMLLYLIGIVFFAFFYNNLFPEQIFNIGRSIEIILAPIIGGVGTLFGPILGAAVLTLLSEGLTHLLAATGHEIPGVKQILYGVALGGAIMFMPHGIWPRIADRFGLHRQTTQAPATGSGPASESAPTAGREEDRRA